MGTSVLVAGAVSSLWLTISEDATKCCAELDARLEEQVFAVLGNTARNVKVRFYIRSIGPYCSGKTADVGGLVRF